MEYELDAQAQKFLAGYLTPDKEYLFYENYTTVEQREFFRRYLLRHLLDTTRLLEKWECEKDLCCAGLFHSLYGTEPIAAANIPFAPLSLNRREEVRLKIGWRVEHIVYLFCAMVKDAFLATVAKQSTLFVFDRFRDIKIPVSRQDARDLLTLTLADWLEPITGKVVDPQMMEEITSSYKSEFMSSSNLLYKQAREDFCLVYGIEEE